MQVPLLDLKAQYATIKDELLAAIAEVMESQHFILGPKVEELRRQLRNIPPARRSRSNLRQRRTNCVSHVRKHRAGDEVITTPYTFFATVGAISRLGATPCLWILTR